MNENIIDEWLESIKNQVKSRTFSRYREIVFTHILPFLQTKRISEFTADEWGGFLYSLSVSGNKRTEKKLSDNAVSQIIGVVKRMHRFFQKCGYLKKQHRRAVGTHKATADKSSFRVQAAKNRTGHSQTSLIT